MGIPTISLHFHFPRLHLVPTDGKSNSLRAFALWQPRFPSQASTPRWFFPLPGLEFTKQCKKSRRSCGQHLPLSIRVAQPQCHLHLHLFVPFFPSLSALLQLSEHRGGKIGQAAHTNSRISTISLAPSQGLVAPKIHISLPIFLRRQNELESCGTAEQGEE